MVAGSSPLASTTRTAAPDTTRRALVLALLARLRLVLQTAGREQQRAVGLRVGRETFDDAAPAVGGGGEAARGGVVGIGERRVDFEALDGGGLLEELQYSRRGAAALPILVVLRL